MYYEAWLESRLFRTVKSWKESKEGYLRNCHSLEGQKVKGQVNIMWQPRLDSKNNRKKRGKYKRKPSEVNKHFNIINNIDLWVVKKSNILILRIKKVNSECISTLYTILPTFVNLKLPKIKFLKTVVNETK